MASAQSGSRGRSYPVRPPVSRAGACGGLDTPGQSHMARREGYASLAPSARSRFPPQKLCQYFPDGIILRWNYSSAIALTLTIDGVARCARLTGASAPFALARHGHRMVTSPNV